MKPIATFCFKPFFSQVGSKWSHTKYFLACARASMEMANLHFGKPTIYTDSIGKAILSKLSNKPNFVDCYEKLYEEYPIGLWALGKIFTYQKQHAPYIHFDLDLIFLRKFNPDLLECDLLVQVQEKIWERPSDMEWVYRLPVVGHLYDLPPLFRRPNPNSIAPLNCGLLLMNNMSLNKIYTDIALDLVHRNIDLFNSPNWLGICVVEQQTLGLLVHDMPDLVCKTMLDDWELFPRNRYMVHFGGDLSKDIKTYYMDKIYKKFILPWLNNDIEVLADAIDKVKQGEMKIDDLYSLCSTMDSTGSS